MKKIILGLSILTLFSVALVSFAQPPELPEGYVPGGSSEIPEVPPIELNIFDLLTRALNWLFGIVIIIAAIMLVWAGFTYITSGGNEEKVKPALNGVIYALIGVAIALLAKGLIYMVCTFIYTGGQCSFF